ncbi:uncharacterized protein JN550_013177 [Neoarthrinium moseri]|uniref:uncharacterized protein n=1 Tax=Neoarthrinium moseri TaxID=1658444 RepID=UPI001FDD7492|nr:uncharacterized protein JN550_013177 [Neoarthrinium moseri]KAI1857544.1 hypothetical protein JN550_013177 [Neoarthrinium moseri]
MERQLTDPFADYGSKDWWFALTILFALLFIMVILILAEIKRKCTTGEFQETMKDAARGVWCLIKAVCRGVLAVPGLIFHAPGMIIACIKARNEECKHKGIQKALLDASKAEAGQAKGPKDNIRARKNDLAPTAATHPTAPPAEALPSTQSLPYRMISRIFR